MSRLKAYLSNTTIDFWAWLFPITYLMHVAEEYWGGVGYSEYLMRLRGVQLSENRFLVAQSVGLILMLAGIFVARRLRFLSMMLVILGATCLANAVSHAITSAAYFAYGPGLLTSLLVWLPLGAATLIRFHGEMRNGRYWTAVLIGVGINIAVGIFTWRGGQFQ